MQKKLLTFFIYLIIFLPTVFAQTIYYNNQNNFVGTIDLDGGCSYNQLFKHTGNNALGDIAFHPNGKMYGTGLNELYEINNGNLILIGNFSVAINSLTCDNNGILYAVGHSGVLQIYDTNTNTFKRLGTIPFAAAGDLTFRDGNLYMLDADRKVILVDINNPAASQEFMTITPVDTLEPFFSIVSFAIDCDSIVTYAFGIAVERGVGIVTRVYSLDFETKTTNFICSVPSGGMNGAASTLEFLASDCELVVDLDLDNSSGALVHDFFVDTTCTSPVVLTDTDVQVYAQVGVVDSMRIRLYEGVLAPGQEYLALAGVTSINVSGSGTTELRLVNTGSATLEDFEAAIQALRYVNDAPSAGVRKIGFTAYAGGDSSKVAVAHVPFGFSGAGAGSDTTLGVCAGAAAIDLFAALGGSATSGGSWQPGNGMFDPATDVAGGYRYIVAGTCGADTAVVTVRLLPTPTQTILDTICSGANYTFGNQNLTQSGTYQDTLQTTSGCDSIVILNLNILQSITKNIADTICSGANYTFGNQNLTQSGTYQDTLQTAIGCDSIVILNLNILQSITQNITDTICSGANYTFGNQNLTQSGTYQDTLQTTSGCDSIIILNLSVLQSITQTVADTICSGGSYTFGNQTLTQSGTYQDTLQTASGCDSIVVLNLNVLQSITKNIADTICSGGSYTFGNQTLTQSGTYQDTLQMASSCDSIIILNLSVLQNITQNITDTICSGGSYTFGNQNLTQSGTYQDTLQTTSGCDSIVVLNLSVLQNITQNITDTICSGANYTFGNQTLTQSGIYQDTLQTTSGCNSIVILNLTVTPSPTVDLFVDGSLCADSSVQLGVNGDFENVTWNNGATTDTISVTSSGIYSVTVHNGSTCTATDSILINDSTLEFIVTTVSPTCDAPFGSITIANLNGGMPPYFYQINNQPLQENPVFDSLTANTYEIIVEDAAGCTQSKTTTITNTNRIALTLSADTSIQAGQTVAIQLQTNAAAPFTVQWTPDSTLNCINCTAVTARPTQSTTYAATLTDANGCMATAQITINSIRKKDEVSFAPNAFSPNGDGVNDYFTIFSGNVIKNVQVMRVFDRWGNLVYQHQNFAPNAEQVGWDGTFNGKLAMQGVYTFYAILEYEDSKVAPVSGEVVLVR